MKEPTVTENASDIQGLLLHGYGRLRSARMAFLRVQDRDRARAWLRQVAPRVTTAGSPPARSGHVATAMNVAFTCRGLAALGVPDDCLQTFSAPFQEGVATERRSRILGDTGQSAPATWHFGGPGQPEIHVLLALYAPDEDAADALLGEARKEWQAVGGVAEAHLERGARLAGEIEPFGFSDGGSQPGIAGSGIAPTPGQDVIAAGEFVLGYRNGYGLFTLSPTIAAEHDPGALLPPSTFAARRDLGLNGTYLVFRKLRQDVAGFWTFFHGQAHDDGEATMLAAKCVGRWPSGAPLVLSPERDDPAWARPEVINRFDYAERDPHGDRCPIGAHIRRANPRDSMPDRPGLSKLESNRHRILRRGIPYGPPAPAPRTRDDGQERGLLFLALQTDIRRQFEFLQQVWLNNPGFGGLYDARDPIVGDNDGAGDMVVPQPPARRRIRGLPRFIDVRGAAYLFLPGLRALRFLAGR